MERMGGNALQAGSVRLAAARYHEVERALVQVLRERFPALRIEAILAYADKADFGDLDILIADGAEYDTALLAAALDATEVVPNGDVTSMGVRLAEGVFQVDLIKIPAPSFDFAARYFGYNDFGNLVGRVAYQFGAKFGHLGLLYQIRDPDNDSHMLAEVSITADFDTALTLLGYDAALYEAMRIGAQFRTLDDIFRFVVSTPYANPEIYLLDNRSHRARIRDAKRATYKAFLQWLEEQPAGTVPSYPWSEDDAAHKERFLQAAFAREPDFKARYDRTHADAARAKQLKLKFNGAVAAQVTGLSGKSLGDLMARVRNSFRDEHEFEAYFLEAGMESVRATFSRAAEKPE
jgi:hypothetical protein